MDIDDGGTDALEAFLNAILSCEKRMSENSEKLSQVKEEIRNLKERLLEVQQKTSKYQAGVQPSHSRTVVLEGKCLSASTKRAALCDSIDTIRQGTTQAEKEVEETFKQIDEKISTVASTVAVWEEMSDHRRHHKREIEMCKSIQAELAQQEKDKAEWQVLVDRVAQQHALLRAKLSEHEEIKNNRKEVERQAQHIQYSKQMMEDRKSKAGNMAKIVLQGKSVADRLRAERRSNLLRNGPTMHQIHGLLRSIIEKMERQHPATNAMVAY